MVLRGRTVGEDDLGDGHKCISKTDVCRDMVLDMIRGLNPKSDHSGDSR